MGTTTESLDGTLMRENYVHITSGHPLPPMTRSHTCLTSRDVQASKAETNPIGNGQPAVLAYFRAQLFRVWV